MFQGSNPSHDLLLARQRHEQLRRLAGESRLRRESRRDRHRQRH